jgi:hypothetical protein
MVIHLHLENNEYKLRYLSTTKFTTPAAIRTQFLIVILSHLIYVPYITYLIILALSETSFPEKNIYVICGKLDLVFFIMTVKCSTIL